jgi:hypothetical protein
MITAVAARVYGKLLSHVAWPPWAKDHRMAIAATILVS